MKKLESVPEIVHRLRLQRGNTRQDGRGSNPESFLSQPEVFGPVGGTLLVCAVIGGPFWHQVSVRQGC